MSKQRHTDLKLGAARVPLLLDNETVAALVKLRRYIYVFRKQRAWRDAFQKQCEVINLVFRQLNLDMPVWWSPAYYVITTALKLQNPIIALCAP